MASAQQLPVSLLNEAVNLLRNSSESSSPSTPTPAVSGSSSGPPLNQESPQSELSRLFAPYAQTDRRNQCARSGFKTRSTTPSTWSAPKFAWPAPYPKKNGNPKTHGSTCSCVLPRYFPIDTQSLRQRS